MGFITRTVKVTTLGAATAAGAFAWATRNDKLVPMTPADRIFSSPAYRNLNPSNNPTTHDYYVRRVPLTDIKPSLLENKGKLTEAFCAGVWSGWGAFFLSTRLNHQPACPHAIKSSTP